MGVMLGGGEDPVARDRRHAMINMAGNAAFQASRAGNPAERELQQRRGEIDQGFHNLRAILQPMAAGQNGPFTNQVQQGLRAQAADNATGQMRAARAVIDRSFGRQGLAGSGGAMRARLDAQRQIGKGLMAQNTQIGTTSALENRAAQDRNISQLMALLDMNRDHNSRFQVTGEGPLDALLAGLGGASGGGSTVFSGTSPRRERSAPVDFDALLGYSGGPSLGATGASFSTWNQPAARTGFAPGQSWEDWLGASDYGTGNYKAEGPMGGIAKWDVPGGAPINDFRRSTYDPTLDMALRKYGRGTRAPMPSNVDIALGNVPTDPYMDISPAGSSMGPSEMRPGAWNPNPLTLDQLLALLGGE